MKILVRLFLIILVIFSFSHANNSILDKLSNSEISYLNSWSATYKRIETRYKKKAEIDTRYKDIYKRYGQYWLKKSKDYADKASSYKKMQKDDRNKLYKTIVSIIKNKKSHLEGNIRWINGYIKRSRRTKYLKSYLNRTEKQIEAYNKTIKQLKEEHEKENSKFGSKFDTWQKKDKINPTKTTLKVSTANKSKTIINSSNLKTSVDTKNITLSGKAKASVGAVSIGKEEKK